MIQRGVVVNLDRTRPELKMLELRLNSLLIEVWSCSAASVSLLIAGPSRTDHPLPVNQTPVSSQPVEWMQTFQLHPTWMRPAQMIRRLLLQARV
jgi:hypothetical protein